jgi:hypothetical protein
MSDNKKQLPTAQTMGLAQANEMAAPKATSHSLAQRESAQVQAQLVAAKRFPRDEMAALDRIINSCTRESLAAVSQYSYSKGGSDIAGPSIKLAQAIAQQWGNIDAGWREIDRYQDGDEVGVSVIEAYAWDIENNYRVPRVFNVRHWRDTRSGGYPIKDEREIYELCANMASRRVRACILSVIPGDIIDEALKQCDTTLHASADTSPEAQHKILAVFKEQGVSRPQIEEFIQRKMDAITPAQVIRLRKIITSLRDGMSEPGDWFKGKHQAAGDAAAKAATEQPEATAQPEEAQHNEAPKDLF